MRFIPGDRVKVTSLGKTGQVVEVDARGRYRVAVGGMTAWCGEGQVEAVARPRKGKPSDTRRPASAVTTRPAEASRGTRPPSGVGTLDLHGLTVPDALDALDERLDLAIRSGLDRLEVIHGISGGRLRAAVRRHLQGAAGIDRVEADPRNQGVTWVWF